MFPLESPPVAFILMFWIVLNQLYVSGNALKTFKYTARQANLKFLNNKNTAVFLFYFSVFLILPEILTVIPGPFIFIINLL